MTRMTYILLNKYSNGIILSGSRHPIRTDILLNKYLSDINLFIHLCMPG